MLAIYLTGEGVDYNFTQMMYNVTFPAGVTCASFDIPINDDMISEDYETFDITIMELSLPYGVILGGTDKATVTIVDNDSKQINLLLCMCLYFPTMHR